ncbi:hypothetical protein LINGRAHAP2_LOCUS20125 [Linum grandiflorum]
MYHGEVSITLQDVAHLTGLSVSGDALYVEYENSTNWAALVQEVLGRSRWTYEGRRKGDDEMAARHLLLLRRRRRRARASTVRMRVHAVQHRSFLDARPIECIRALSVSSDRGRAHEYISWRHWWMDGATAGMVFGALPQHCTQDARARSQTTSESDSTSYS